MDFLSLVCRCWASTRPPSPRWRASPLWTAKSSPPTRSPPTTRPETTPPPSNRTTTTSCRHRRQPTTLTSCRRRCHQMMTFCRRQSRRAARSGPAMRPWSLRRDLCRQQRRRVGEISPRGNLRTLLVLFLHQEKGGGVCYNSGEGVGGGGVTFSVRLNQSAVDWTTGGER